MLRALTHTALAHLLANENVCQSRLRLHHDVCCVWHDTASRYSLLVAPANILNAPLCLYRQ